MRQPALLGLVISLLVKRAAEHRSLRAENLRLLQPFQARTYNAIPLRLEGNVLNADPAWFAGLADNDLHLTERAAGAIGKAGFTIAHDEIIPKKMMFEGMSV